MDCYIFYVLEIDSDCLFWIPPPSPSETTSNPLDLKCKKVFRNNQHLFSVYIGKLLVCSSLRNSGYKRVKICWFFLRFFFYIWNRENWVLVIPLMKLKRYLNAKLENQTAKDINWLCAVLCPKKFYCSIAPGQRY